MRNSNSLGGVATVPRRYDRPSLPCGPPTHSRRRASLSVPLIIMLTGRFEKGLDAIVLLRSLHTCCYPLSFHSYGLSVGTLVFMHGPVRVHNRDRM